MLSPQVAITGIEGYVPENILTNTDLEKLVNTSDEWITTRVGIKERRILDKKLPTSHMAIECCKKLIKKKNLDPLDIDLIICATITPDMPIPATANIISYTLGATNAVGFDIQAACSGFLYSLITAQNFLLSGKYKKALVIGADKMSSITDFQDRNTCVIFGDGAGVALLEHNEEGLGIEDSILKSDGAGKEYLYIKAGGSQHPATKDTVENREHYIKQEGGVVYKHAVQGMQNAVEEIMQKNNLSHDDIDYVVPHQANVRIINSVMDKLGIPREKAMVNLDLYGNTTGATLPLCLWDYEKKLKKGDKLILVAFGAGFTWGSIYLKWAYNYNE